MIAALWNFYLDNIYVVGQSRNLDLRSLFYLTGFDLAITNIHSQRAAKAALEMSTPATSAVSEDDQEDETS